MDTISKIKAILKEQLNATVIEIEDESHLHAHHKGRMNSPVGSGHYNAIVVSEQFAGKTTMQQHRLVYSALAEEMKTSIHALSLKTLTPDQWQKI